jgi:nucleoside-diphosphate-sugar epimerase
VNNPKGSRRESVLVFGANGFLGSVVTKKLSHSGFDVLPVIRPGANKARLQNMSDIKLLEVESDRWPGIVTEYAPDAVICAQWNGVLKQDRENIDLQITNIEPILNIAIATKVSGAGKFLCFGSQAEARESVETIGEEFYNSGQSAYGNIKARLHEHLASLFEDSDCRFIWARVFSVYGPSDFSDSLLMRLFESQALGDELVLLNPSKLWSILYEDDFASAIEQILKNPNIKNTINIGSTTLHEIKEIAATWQGSTVVDLVDHQTSSTNLGFFPDVTKLKAIGWVPSISLEEGIKRTRKAFSDRVNPR